MLVVRSCILEKSRVQIFPCLIPEVTGATSEDYPSRTSDCVRCDRKADIHFNVSFCIP